MSSELSLPPKWSIATIPSKSWTVECLRFFFFDRFVVNALNTFESVVFWRLPWEQIVERRQAVDL